LVWSAFLTSLGESSGGGVSLGSAITSAWISADCSTRLLTVIARIQVRHVSVPVPLDVALVVALFFVILIITEWSEFHGGCRISARVLADRSTEAATLIIGTEIMTKL